MRKIYPLTGIATAAASASGWLRRGRPVRLLLVLPALLIGACGSPQGKANGTREHGETAQSAPDARMIASLREAAGWANRTLTRAEIDSYTRTPNVLETLRVQRRELALARLCWPETRAMDRESAGRPIPEENIRANVRALGLDPDEIDCSPFAAEGSAPTRARRPSGSTADLHTPESFDSVLASSQAVIATLMPAVCEGRLQLPDPNTPIPPIRRRWTGEIRIQAPDDAVLRDEFLRVLTDPRLREAVRGLSIRLVDRNPNVVVRGLTEAERCYDSDPENGICGAPFAGRCGGTRLRKYDRLAADVTAGRRSYLRDASAFAGSPARGFTLSDAQGRIDGAVCLLADEAVGGPAASGPGFSREAKAMLAVECVAQVLGVGGPPASIRPRRGPSRLMLTTLDNGRVVLSNVAITLLAELYKT